MTRALLLMTPLMVDRLGSERHEFDRTFAAAFPGGSSLTTAEPGPLRRALGQLEPDVIIAAGGDGTVNLALQAMRASDSLALLPLGTANDLARCLGVCRNPHFLGSFVLDTACTIDVLRVNDQRFCTTGGLGLPADIADRVNRIRNHLAEHTKGGWADRIGSSLYPIVGAEVCVRTPPLYRLDIEWDDPSTGSLRTTRVETAGLFVTNQSTFAHSLQVVRDADNADGIFELCILLPHGRGPLLRLLGRIVQHAIPARDVAILRTRRASIRADREVRFYGDGELLEKASEFELTIEPRGLRLLS